MTRLLFPGDEAHRDSLKPERGSRLAFGSRQPVSCLASFKLTNKQITSTIQTQIQHKTTKEITLFASAEMQLVLGRGVRPARPRARAVSRRSFSRDAVSLISDIVMIVI